MQWKNNYGCFWHIKSHTVRFRWHIIQELLKWIVVACVPLCLISWAISFFTTGTAGEAGLLPRALVSVFHKISTRLYPAVDLKPVLSQEVRRLNLSEIRAEEARRHALLKEVKLPDKNWEGIVFLVWCTIVKRLSVMNFAFFIYSPLWLISTIVCLWQEETSRLRAGPSCSWDSGIEGLSAVTQLEGENLVCFDILV